MQPDINQTRSRSWFNATASSRGDVIRRARDNKSIGERSRRTFPFVEDQEGDSLAGSQAGLHDTGFNACNLFNAVSTWLVRARVAAHAPAKIVEQRELTPAIAAANLFPCSYDGLGVAPFFAGRVAG